MINDSQLNKKEKLINKQNNLIQLISVEKKNDEITLIAKEAIKAEKLTKINECFDKLIDFCFTHKDNNNDRIIRETLDILKGKKAQLAYGPKVSLYSLDDTKEASIRIIKENLERVGLNNNKGAGFWSKIMPIIENYLLGQNQQDYKKAIEEYEETIRNCPDSASATT